MAKQRRKRSWLKDRWLYELVGHKETGESFRDAPAARVASGGSCNLLGFN